MKPKIIILGFLLFLVIVFGFYLKTTLSTHIVFGDEGFHVRLSQLIAENREYMTWFGTNLDKTGFGRPPLFNILQASFLFVFGFHESIIKILTPFIAVMTGLALFLLAKKLYNIRIGLLSSITLVTLPSFVTYSVLFYTDILFTFYTTLFILLFLLYIKDDNRKYLMLSAIFASLAFLTKITSVIFLAFVALSFVYLLARMKTWPKIKIFREAFIFTVIFLFFTSPFLLRNFYYYQTALCDTPLPFFDNFGCYMSDFEQKYKFPPRSGEGQGTESSLLRFGLSNFINFAYGGWSDNVGPLKFIYKILTPFANSLTQFTGLAFSSLFLIMGLLGGVIILAIKREHIGILLLTLLALIFIVIYQAKYRTEDTARHILSWAPFLAILSSVYWNEVYRFLNRFYKYLGMAIIVLVLLIGLQNLTSKLSAMESVKQFSPLFFEACDWVKENLSKDSMLMTFWGYRAGYNCQRHVSSGYADIRLSNDPEYMSDFAKQHGVTHFFIQKFSIRPEAARETYSIEFVKLLEDNPEYFEKVYENGPPLENCFTQVCDGNIIYKLV